jgi:hypothetical protein
VVFSGTVRTNLDPFGEYGADAILWEAIRDVGLQEQVEHVGGLDAKLDGTGAGSWSLGQQQLMCLARAALKKVPILCLDEATAAMDPHTEAYVLEIIERLFSDRTTLTIAHRWACLGGVALCRWWLGRAAGSFCLLGCEGGQAAIETTQGLPRSSLSPSCILLISSHSPPPPPSHSGWTL